MSKTTIVTISVVILLIVLAYYFRDKITTIGVEKKTEGKKIGDSTPYVGAEDTSENTNVVDDGKNRIVGVGANLSIPASSAYPNGLELDVTGEVWDTIQKNDGTILYEVTYPDSNVSDNWFDYFGFNPNISHSWQGSSQFPADPNYLIPPANTILTIGYQTSNGGSNTVSSKWNKKIDLPSQG